MAKDKYQRRVEVLQKKNVRKIKKRFQQLRADKALEDKINKEIEQAGDYQEYIKQCYNISKEEVKDAKVQALQRNN